MSDLKERRSWPMFCCSWWPGKICETSAKTLEPNFRPLAWFD